MCRTRSAACVAMSSVCAYVYDRTSGISGSSTSGSRSFSSGRHGGRSVTPAVARATDSNATTDPMSGEPSPLIAVSGEVENSEEYCVANAAEGSGGEGRLVEVAG